MIAAPSDSALVLSWGGHATSTWEDFQADFRELPEARRTDALFLGYPSRTHTVAFCAAALRKFLTDLLENPAELILNPSMPPTARHRPTAFRYEKMILCAHSMGAVIVRRAIIDLDGMKKLGRSGAPTIRMLLFAPAHKGSNVALMAISGFGLDWIPGATLLTNILRVRFRSLDDLVKGSDTLRQLEEDSRKMRIRRSRRKGETPQKSDRGYFRASVLHAADDRVVEQESFDNDPPFIPVMNRDHRNICKPGAFYRQPIDELLQVLL